MRKTRYDLVSFKLPVLSGRKLKLFAALLENGVSGPPITRKLFKDAGIERFRKMRLDEPPTLFPFSPGDEKENSSGESAGGETDAPGPFTGKPGDRKPAGAVRMQPTVEDFARAYHRGETTPEAVAEKVIDAVRAGRRGEKPLRAFIAQDEEDLMAQAAASAKRIRNGKALGILDGVPVAVKDEVDQVPYPTTVGTTFMGRLPAGTDATVVARLRRAGALLVGKTNMHEIGINPNGLNVHYGPVRNPYHPDHDTGGSSSGSAAAVAAGICPVAVGADGGGSIRVPAALCGIVGLKPTFGRISEAGAAPLCWSVAHLGPLGASVADVALAYQLMAGPDQRDPNTLGQPPVTLRGWDARDLSGIRLGIYPEWFDHATAAVSDACHRMLERLTAAGAEVSVVRIAELAAMQSAHAITIFSEMAASMANLGADKRDFGAGVRINLAAGRRFTAGDYVHAQRMRTRAMECFKGVFREVDLILSPATAITAPRIPEGGLPLGWSDLSSESAVTRYVFPANLTGLPAISFPAGYDEKGLPIGMQAMGNWWREDLLLRVASVAEHAMERRRPETFHALIE